MHKLYMFGALVFVDFLVKIFKVSQVNCNSVWIYMVGVFYFVTSFLCDTLASYKCGTA